MAHTQSLDPMDEAAFDLRRPRHRPDPSAMAPSVEVDDEEVVDDDELVAVVPPLPRRARIRRRAVQILGTLAIAGAFLGFGRIAGDARARHAILDWVTLGHGAQAHGAEVMLRGWAAAISQR